MKEIWRPKPPHQFGMVSEMDVAMMAGAGTTMEMCVASKDRVGAAMEMDVAPMGGVGAAMDVVGGAIDAPSMAMTS